ncbi:hypothetical protein [Thermoactinomyces mirandus]|nr:hypothetical protein [Thermoactinomyces mirandus]
MKALIGEKLGLIDGIVNNAGWTQFKPFFNMNRKNGKEKSMSVSMGSFI